MHGQRGIPAPVRSLAEAAATIEYDAANGVAALTFEAESEDALRSVEIRDAAGDAVLRIGSVAPQRLRLGGFVLESHEASLGALQAKYAPGFYSMRARTVEGETLGGGAVLSYELPDAPVMLAPLDGATAVPVNFTLSWIDVPSAAGYRIVIEQDENDGLKVSLPAGKSSFQVPDGVLAPGVETHVELSAVGECGNRTMVEVTVTTS
jgi:hypothetical protein